MGTSVFHALILFFLLASTARSQEIPGIQLESEQMNLPQLTPVAPQLPTAKSQSVEEEHPRLFWIFPTYTVSESQSPSPLTAGGKWRLYVKDKTDPFTFGWVAFEAGISRRTMIFSDMGRGLPGYGKRFGAGLANEFAGGFFGTFLFPSVLHQDPRYYRLGGGPFKKRLGHALIRPILTHKDSCERTFNWSGVLGSIATSSLANAYYPEGDRGVGPTFSRVGMSIPFSMIDELFNEFGPDLQKKINGKK